MKKIWAILITLGAMVVIYLFLLVGLPALEAMLPSCGDYSSNETGELITSNVTANWTAVGPALEVRPYSVIYKTPLVIYLIPGIIGIMIIVYILRQKGGKLNE